MMKFNSKKSRVRMVNRKITHETLSFNEFKSGKETGLKLAVAIITDLKHDIIIDGLTAREVLQVAIDTIKEYGK